MKRTRLCRSWCRPHRELCVNRRGHFDLHAHESCDGFGHRWADLPARQRVAAALSRIRSISPSQGKRNHRMTETTIRSRVTE